MMDNAKLELPPPLHIGAQIDLTDPVLKDYGERLTRRAREMRAVVDALELGKQEMEALREIFWARLHEILPATEDWNMKLAPNGTHVVVAQRISDGADCDCDGCKGLKASGSGPMPEALKKAIAKVFGKQSSDE